MNRRSLSVLNKKPMNNSTAKQKQKAALSEKEQVLVDLALDKKEPQSAQEKELKKEIEAIKNSGKMIQLPHD